MHRIFKLSRPERNILPEYLATLSRNRCSVRFSSLSSGEKTLKIVAARVPSASYAPFTLFSLARRSGKGKEGTKEARNGVG